MKILVVDDHPNRYKDLESNLLANNVGSPEIAFCNNSFKAAELLESNDYDLMVLDVLIPKRPEQDADKTNSIELLVSLMETGDYCIPKRVIGITGDETAALEAEPVFEKYFWTVLSYKPDNLEWLHTLTSCCVYLGNSKEKDDQESFRNDIVVLCAVRASELPYILDLPYGFSSAEPIDDETFVYKGQFHTQSQNRSIIVACAPRMGMVATANLAVKMIVNFRPKYIVMLGICAGVKGKTKLGDILFVDPSWDWQTGKFIKDDDGAPRQLLDPDYIAANSRVRAHADLISSDKRFMRDIVDSWNGNKPEAPRFKVGPVASGSAVLANPDMISDINVQNRNLLGIEMEVYGLYAACQSVSNPRPGFFAVKSVCDFADEFKNDEFQPYAAYSSAKWLELYLKRYGELLFAC